METKKLLEKYYFINIRQFRDKEERPRQALDIIPELVYETSRSGRDERNIHLIWYSNPDPKTYNSWDFNQLIIIEPHLEILHETALITKIASINDETQPQEFEQILQQLGFQRKTI